MNIVDSLGLTFEDQEKSIGASFVEDGNATLTESGPSAFEAEVKHFKRVHYVWVEAGSPATHGCDCPHFEETGKGCEHLWALKLLLDSEDDVAFEDEPEDVKAATFRPIFGIQISDSLRQNTLVVGIFDDSRMALQVDHKLWAQVDHEDDIAAFRAIAAFSGGWRDVRQGGGFNRPTGPWQIPDEGRREVLEALVATGRLFALDPGQSEGEPVTKIGESFELALDPGSSRNKSIRGFVAQNRKLINLAEVKALIPGREPWIIVENELSSLTCFGAEGWARTLRSQGEIVTNTDDNWGFLTQLAASYGLPRITIRKKLLPIKEIAPQVKLHYAERGQEAIAYLGFRYGDASLTPSHKGDLITAEDLSCQYLRAIRVEDSYIQELLHEGFEADPLELGQFKCPVDEGRKALKKLIARRWEVYMEDRQVHHVSVGEFHIEKGEDWFSIDGTVTGLSEDAPSFGDLFVGFRSDSPWIEAGDGSIALLDEKSRKEMMELAPLQAMGNSVDDEFRIKEEGALLAGLVLANSEIPGASALEEVQANLERRLAHLETEPCDGFVGTLRPYQKEGLSWLSFLKESGLGGCLADEMGLGKTVQILALLHASLKNDVEAPFLVVAPLSLIANWRNEANRFCPEMKVREYHGSKRSLDGLSGGELVLTSYGIVRRDIEKLKDVRFEFAVLDEAQAVKNKASQTRIAAGQLKATTRIALSGTPLENRIDELWSLFKFLNPSLFAAGAPLESITRLSKEVDPASWRQALKPLLLRRTKDLVIDDLPDLVEQTIVVAMPDDQRKVYREIEASARKELLAEKKTPAAILQGLLRLRQAATHPALLPGENDARSGKIELLMQHLDDAVSSGRKSLVFSQFTSLLDIVEEDLEKAKIKSLRLDGKTRNRGDVVDQFQSDADVSVLLISLKAGGVGLNLTAAEVVFLLDPWWNPAIESQAIARAHRIGQTSQVHAMRLVSEGTVEERIMRLQEKKRALADSILEAAPEGLGGLEAGDLKALLGA